MNFIEKKIKEWDYLFAGLHKDKANIRLLEAVDEIQKFSAPICFRGYPKKENICPRFDEEACCGANTCPLFELNKQYIKAKKEFDEATIARYKAQTLMFCSKVRE
jgi:hypothetical protein